MKFYKNKPKGDLIVSETMSLAKAHMKLADENAKLEQQNKEYEMALAKLARKMEDDKTRRN